MRNQKYDPEKVVEFLKGRPTEEFGPTMIGYHCLDGAPSSSVCRVLFKLLHDRKIECGTRAGTYRIKKP